MRAILHTDKANCGMSVVCSFGEYAGGQLLQWPAQDWPTMADIQARPILCDGRDPHVVLPFFGTRYSVVAFTHKIWEESVGQQEALMLAEAGFPLPNVNIQARGANFSFRNDGMRVENAKRDYVALCRCVVDESGSDHTITNPF